MASGFTTALRNQILTAEFKTDTIYGACCDADPGDAGSTASEIAATWSYERTEITCGDDAAAGSIANTVALEFPAASGGDWGTISHLAIATTDVEADGKFSASGALTSSKKIEDGDQLVFAVGNITISIAAQA
jgi:hypothetical protein